MFNPRAIWHAQPNMFMLQIQNANSISYVKIQELKLVDEMIITNQNEAKIKVVRSSPNTHHVDKASMETSASSKNPANRVRAIIYHTSKLQNNISNI